MISGSPPLADKGTVEAAFPNPTYRRKLRWGIRRKAARSVEDWKLYFGAAAKDERLLPPNNPLSSTTPPLFADPLVTVLGRLRRRLRRPPPRARLERDSRDLRGD